jgi:hypothetical protein
MRDKQESTGSQSFDGTEIQDFVRRVVTTTKPRLAVEIRADAGFTLPLLQGLKDNGFGQLIVCDADAARRERLRQETGEIGVQPPIAVELRDQSALKSKFDGPVDLLVCSRDHEQVVRQLLPEVNPCGAILLYAGEDDHKAMRDSISKIEKEGLLSVVRLPESLRLLMAQGRVGRK